MKFIGIKDSKIFDICSDLVNKRIADNGIFLSKEDLEKTIYIESEETDLMIGDSWDSKQNISLKDSLQRFAEPEKSEQELKVIELEATITAINERLSKIEEALKIPKV